MIFSKNYLDTTTGNLLIQSNGFDYSVKKIVPHYDNLSVDMLKDIGKDVLKVRDSDKLIKLDTNKIVYE